MDSLSAFLTAYTPLPNWLIVFALCVAYEGAGSIKRKKKATTPHPED